jgi:hypothetical protein
VGSVPPGALSVLCEGRVVCMRDLLILNELREQHKHIFRHFAWMTYFYLPLITGAGSEL